MSKADSMRAVADRWKAPAASRGRDHPRLATVSSAVVVSAVVGVILIVAMISIQSLRLSPVLSGSMRPEVQPGDLAVVGPVPTTALEPGDVISFYPPGRNVAVIHRLVTVTSRDDGVWVSTKGDANEGLDPWGEVRLRGDTAWRLLEVVPFAGFVPMWMQGVRGPLLLVVGAVLALSALRAVRESPTRVMHPHSAFSTASEHRNSRPAWRDPGRDPGRRFAG